MAICNTLNTQQINAKPKLIYSKSTSHFHHQRHNVCNVMMESFVIGEHYMQVRLEIRWESIYIYNTSVKAWIASVV
jgi:hypothetical protein